MEHCLLHLPSINRTISLSTRAAFQFLIPSHPPSFSSPLSSMSNSYLHSMFMSLCLKLAFFFHHTTWTLCPFLYLGDETHTKTLNLFFPFCFVDLCMCVFFFYPLMSTWVHSQALWYAENIKCSRAFLKYKSLPCTLIVEHLTVWRTQSSSSYFTGLEVKWNR